jgi:hypothetical protein
VYPFNFLGADGRNRTADLLITNQLLCRLSYVGSTSKFEYLHGGRDYPFRG